MDKTIVLIQGKSGSGKDFLMKKVSEELQKKGNKVLRFAHADILKGYISDLFNIPLDELYSSKKDHLYIIFNRTDLLNPARIYDETELASQIAKYREVWDETDIYEFFNTHDDSTALYDMYNNGTMIFVSLRSLLVYFGVYVMKKRMPPFLMLYHSINKTINSEEFKNCDYFIVTDNRFDSEIDLMTDVAVKNKYDIKFIHIDSDLANDLDNIAEHSLTVNIENYIPLDDIMLVDNSDRTEEGTKKVVDEIVEFLDI